MKEKHECDLDKIEWNDKPEQSDIGIIGFAGVCPICGREYEAIYSYSGIWDSTEKICRRTEPRALLSFESKL